MVSTKPDPACLYDVASQQLGHVTTSQARGCGYDKRNLGYHASTGTLIRVGRGVYRLRDYPSSPFEDTMAAWLRLGRDRTIVSHETALAMHELSNVIPTATHLTIRRAKRRNLPTIAGVTIHTVTREIPREQTVVRHGMRVTNPLRTILDAAESGTGPEQIELAVAQAIDRGLVDPQELIEAAASRPRRVRSLVQHAIEAAAP
jgi:predicted transcriptional regulator of viral defense system